MSLLIILTGLAIFGVVHSVLAGQNVKQRVRERIGTQRYEAFYRLTYNLLAVVMLAPVALLLLVAPGGIVWQVESPLVTLVFNGLRLAGLLGLTVSLLQIDLGRFAGWSQLRAYLNGTPLPLPDEPLQTGGLYGRVRHPLYFFSLLVLWPAPTMTEALLALNIGSTVYFLIGSIYEERHLTQTFGDAYRQYQARVPWMLPSLRGATHPTLRKDS